MFWFKNVDKVFYLKDQYGDDVEISAHMGTAIPSQFCEVVEEGDEAKIVGDESERRECLLIRYEMDGEDCDVVHLGISEMPKSDEGLKEQIENEEWYERDGGYMCLATFRDKNGNRLFDDGGIPIYD